MKIVQTGISNEIKILKGVKKMRDLRPGDVVHCQGIVCTIKEIVWQEPWEWREAYYLEFRDTNGVYRSWKQNYDGGFADLMEIEAE